MKYKIGRKFKFFRDSNRKIIVGLEAHGFYIEDETLIKAKKRRKLIYRGWSKKPLCRFLYEKMVKKFTSEWFGYKSYYGYRKSIYQKRREIK